MPRTFSMVPSASSSAGDPLNNWARDSALVEAHFQPNNLAQPHSPAQAASPCPLVPPPRQPGPSGTAGRRPNLPPPPATGGGGATRPGRIMGDYTIQISNKLIDQLARDDEKVERKTRKPKPKKKTTEQHHEEAWEGSPAKQVPTEPNASTPAPGWPLQPPPMFLPVTPAPPPPPAAATVPEVEAIRSVLKESEKLLEKLEKQEAGAREELSRRAKELHEKEFKLPYQSPMPCAHERADCLECYKSNAKDPLKCAEAVKRFEACALMAMKSGNAKAS